MATTATTVAARTNLALEVVGITSPSIAGAVTAFLLSLAGFAMFVEWIENARLMMGVSERKRAYFEDESFVAIM